MANLDTISVALFESQSARYTKLLRCTLIGWALSVILLVGLLYNVVLNDMQQEDMSISQESADTGTNNYIGGDSVANYYSSQDETA
jgi:hypothetical protein